MDIEDPLAGNQEEDVEEDLQQEEVQINNPVHKTP